jgi:transposase
MAHQRDFGKERFWRRALARKQRSGLSVAAFCARERLKTPSFYWWQRELTRRDEAATAFVPVQVIESASTEAETLGIEVLLANGRRLLAKPGFDPETLRRVVGVLEESVC